MNMIKLFLYILFFILINSLFRIIILTYPNINSSMITQYQIWFNQLLAYYALLPTDRDWFLTN